MIREIESSGVASASVLDAIALKLLAVDLPVRKRRKRDQRDGSGWHVNTGQMNRELLHQWLCGHSGCDKDDNLGLAIGIFGRHSERRVHTFALERTRGDMAKLDAHAVNLDLIVTATKVLHLAIYTPLHEVTRLIHERGCPGSRRVCA